MADQKVSDLPSLNGVDVNAADLLYIVDSSAGTAGSKKITMGQFDIYSAAATQTLTNKTISGLNNTISNVSLTTGVTGTLPVANGGTGVGTFTANNVLLGNGTSTFQAVAPGASGNLLTSNGTTWQSAAPPVGSANLQVFSSSGTWTKPSGAQFVMVELWGAGGGGGSGQRRSTDRTGGAGGGGGARVFQMYRASDLAASYTVTIGAGGSGGAAQTTNDTGGNAGSAGGDTTFGAVLAAYGGGGGAGGAGGGDRGGNGGGSGGSGGFSLGGTPQTDRKSVV
jgi:hypothetical protein